jgi:flagellar motor switch protein FliN/FliY
MTADNFDKKTPDIGSVAPVLTETVDTAVQVDPVAFDEIVTNEPTSPDEDGKNLDLILDVEVPVSVVLGNVKKSIGEVVSMTEGQVIDLERSAGEAVDLLVNGKLVARGEVVVVDDHYGIRIAEIIAPGDRVS